MTKSILTKEELEKKIRDYYLRHCGERKTDVWFEPPAANVRVFLRDGVCISLKAHILTGEVEEFSSHEQSEI